MRNRPRLAIEKEKPAAPIAPREGAATMPAARERRLLPIATCIPLCMLGGSDYGEIKVLVLGMETPCVILRLETVTALGK